jgi:hypothetical protein
MTNKKIPKKFIILFVLLLWIIATTIIFNIFNSCLGICFHKSINIDGDVPTLEEVK